MTELQNDYQTASTFGGFVEFIGWFAIAVTIIGGISLYSEAGGLALVVLPLCFATALVGLILVVSGQSLKAQLDTANATKQLLALELAKQTDKGG